MRILTTFIILLFFSITHAKEIANLEPPYTFNKVRAWQQSLDPWPWHYPPEQRVNLRKGHYQLMEVVEGGMRSGSYVIFNRTKEGWEAISSEVAQSHHPIRVLSHTVNGWHDFQTFNPLWGSGGNEVLVITYRWNGNEYVELKEQEGKFCNFKPFKDNTQLCRH